MQGRFRTAAEREDIRRFWASTNIPSHILGEVYPLKPLLSRWSDLVAVDVGANKGLWAKALLNTFPGGVAQIHMLDPSPENYRELMEREDSLAFEAADFPKLSAYPYAAGARRGTAVLYTNEEGSPLASLYPHSEGGEASTPGSVPLRERLEVEVVPLDVLLEERGIDHVDILKLDVEGHEYAVLEGAERALRAGQIDVLFWEFGMHQVESRRFFIDFWTFLTERGYDLYAVDDVSARRIERYERRFENFTRNFDFAARRRDAPLVQPPEGFDEAEYLAANPDVTLTVRKGTFESGRQHWLTLGHQESRPLRSEMRPQPPADFDEAAYLAANPSMARAVEAGDFLSGLDHWMLFGHREPNRKLR